MIATIQSASEGTAKAQAHRKHALRLAVASSILSKGGTLALLLLAMPLTYHILGEERLGVFGVLQLLMWLIGMSDLGVSAGVGRRLTVATSLEDREEQSRVMSTGFFTLTAMIAFIGLIGFVVWLCVPVETLFGQNFGPHAAELSFNLLLSGAIFLTMMVVGILLKIREANHEIHFLNMFGAAGNVISAVLLLVGIRLVPQIWFLLVSIYGVQLLMFTLNVYTALRRRPWLKPRLGKFDKSLATSLCVEGLAFFVLVGITPVFGREFIRWLLGHYYNPTIVAHFSILAQLGFAFFGLIFMVTYPLGPALVDATARKDYPWVRGMAQRLRKLWLIAMVAVPTGMALFGPWAVSMWFRHPIPLSRLELGSYGLFLMLSIWTHIHCVLLAGLGCIQPAARIAAAECLAICLGAWLGVKSAGISGGLLGGCLGMAVTSFVLMPLLFRRSLGLLASAQRSKVAPL